jgi:flagellin-like hook-associated protein FlgL
MADIALNSAVRSNLRSMQGTTELMNRTEERLSSGKKVNSALDNPSNFFTAQSLDRRSSDLSNLLDSVSNSVQTLKAADNGISSISDLVNQMKSTARSAQQSTSAVTTRGGFTSAAITGATSANLLGSASNATVAAPALENNQTAAADITSATLLTTAANADTLKTANAISAGDTLTVNGKTIQFYADAATATAGTADVKIALDTGTIGDVLTGITTALGAGSTATVEDGAITVTGADKTQSFTFGGTAATALGLPTTENAPVPSVLSGKTLEVKVGDLDKKTITFGSGDGQVDTLEELNAELKDSGASASIDSTGKLKIQTSNAYEDDTITIGGTLVSTDGSADADAGEIFEVADTASATSSPVIDDTGKRARTDYRNDFNDTLDQIRTLAKDASYNGVNLLAGDDLKVVFNEDGKSSLNIAGVDVLDTLGLSALSGDEFMDSSSLDKVVSTLNSALSGLDSLSSKFGSQLSVVQTRQDFTKSMIGTLDDGSNTLTAADTNEEAANLATLQTRQSLIVSSLSISTSQEQNILQLLR